MHAMFSASHKKESSRMSTVKQKDKCEDIQHVAQIVSRFEANHWMILLPHKCLCLFKISTLLVIKSWSSFCCVSFKYLRDSCENVRN